MLRAAAPVSHRRMTRIGSPARSRRSSSPLARRAAAADKPDAGPGVAETSAAAAPRPGDRSRPPPALAIGRGPEDGRSCGTRRATGLLIADAAGNRILQWTDGGGVAGGVRDLPPAPENSGGLGQLVLLPDGKIYVTRTGAGTAGAVLYAAPDGTTGAVPGLDPHRHRIGSPG